MTDRIKALEDALTLAANRLQRIALDFDTGSRRFFEVVEWVDSAHAALAASRAASDCQQPDLVTADSSQPAQPMAVAVKPLVWIATGDAGDFMAYDPLFERQVLSLEPAAYDTERLDRIMAALDVQPLTVQDAARVVADAINNDMQTFNKALASIEATPEMPVRHFFAEAILAYAAALRAIAEGK